MIKIYRVLVKTVFTISLIAGLTAISGCSDMDAPSVLSDSGEEGTVSLTLIKMFETEDLESRSLDNSVTIFEGDSLHNGIKDIWVIEYDNSGGIIGTPQYFSGEDISTGNIQLTTILPTTDVPYKLVVLGNTHRPYMLEQLKSASTIEKLQSMYFEFTKESDAYNKLSDGTGDLLFNGVVSLTKDSSSLECQLFRNVAKITVEIINKAGADVEIKSVQLKNISNRITYADQLLGNSVTSPGAMHYNFPSKAWEPTSGPDGNPKMELSYYIPRNQQGKVEQITTKQQKNTFAPPLATFVEVTGIDKRNDRLQRYRFYLGTDMTSDFNIIPNHHYKLPIVISGPGNANTDSRVETFDRFRTMNSANCYIINYLGADNSAIYSIPITRINDFWENYSSAIENKLGDNEPWIAEVVWQDVNAELFKFVDANGVDVTGHKFEGSGLTPFRVRAAGNIPGNVVIGIRKKNADVNTDGYLWSWHLWITDYDPTYDGAAKDGVYEYKLTGGGALHRYGGKWLETHTEDFMMDRNLGAHSAMGNGIVTGLYYEYGRKDPFYPSTTQIYKYDDKDNIVKHSFKKQMSLITMEFSVRHPDTYASNGDNAPWCSDISYEEWPRGTYQAAEAKSIYDPTPEGWEIPKRDDYKFTDYITPHPTINDDRGYVFLLSNDTPDQTGFLPKSGYIYPTGGNLIMNDFTKSTLMLNERYSDCPSIYIYINDKEKLNQANLNQRRGRAITMRLIRRRTN